MGILITPSEELRVLELSELELQLELERRRRAKQRETTLLVQPEATRRDEAFASAFPLRQYIREAFSVVEKGRKFENNWHIEVIAELLQACTLGQVKHAIINIPRRTMKSTLVCIFWPTWTWTFMPWTRWIFTSYSKEFAKRDNEKCAELIKSAYYQERFGDKFSLTIDRRDKLGNDRGGYRSVFAIGKGLGDGGDFVVADDPNDIETIESDDQLKKTANGWNEVSYHNVIDRRTAVRVIMQQRTDRFDLTGSIKANDKLSKLYQHLVLPMHYDPENPFRATPEEPLKMGQVTPFEAVQNPELIAGEEKLFIDPRSVDALTFNNNWYRWWYRNIFQKTFGLTTQGAGQNLWPTYLDPEILEQEEGHLGPFGKASQWQQFPRVRGGNYFKSDDFEIVDLHQLDVSQLTIFLRSWDKAGSENEGDYSAGVLWARTQRRPYHFYILDLYHRQVGYKNRMAAMEECAKRDVENWINGRSDAEYSILIEQEPNASGKSMAEIERDYLARWNAVCKKPVGNKAGRAKALKLATENGVIKMLRANWNHVLLEEFEDFNPAKEKQADDIVDAAAQGYNRLAFSNLGDEDGSSSGEY